MKNNNENSGEQSALAFAWSQKKLTAFGFTLGVSLIVVAIVLDMLSHGFAFGADSIAKLYGQNVTHWIILTSPFFLASVFFWMARMVGNRQRLIEAKLTEEQRQSHILENVISQLQNANFNVEIPSEFKNKLVASRLETFKSKLSSEKIQDEQRSWDNQGLATFGDLLRKDVSKDELSYNVLRFLVKYLSANQGSLFLTDASNEMLELRACFAYDKKKFISKQIPVGQGLVGQCFLEKETILLYDVPDGYINITSGLGLANPNCIAIIPIKHNETVVGVIELASFDRLQRFQITFAEKCAEAFASVVQSVIVNENVKDLLNTSHQQMEELRAQEEEMRQNMEELQAIQEQMTRQLEENIRIKNRLEAREHVLAQTTILSESDLYGTITYINPKFTEVSGYTSGELVGKPHSLVRHPDMPKELFKKMWTTIKAGNTFRGVLKNRRKDGGVYWVDATIVPIMENGKVVKYIGARYHITDEEIAESLFERQMELMRLTELASV